MYAFSHQFTLHFSPFRRANAGEADPWTDGGNGPAEHQRPLEAGRDPRPEPGRHPHRRLRVAFLTNLEDLLQQKKYFLFLIKYKHQVKFIGLKQWSLPSLNLSILTYIVPILVL